MWTAALSNQRRNAQGSFGPAASPGRARSPTLVHAEMDSILGRVSQEGPITGTRALNSATEVTIDNSVPSERDWTRPLVVAGSGLLLSAGLLASVAILEHSRAGSKPSIGQRVVGEQNALAPLNEPGGDGPPVVTGGSSSEIETVGPPSAAAAGSPESVAQLRSAAAAGNSNSTEAAALPIQSPALVEVASVPAAKLGAPAPADRVIDTQPISLEAFTGVVLRSQSGEPKVQGARERRDVPIKMAPEQALQISGVIRNSDYPRAARRAAAEGVVFVRFEVQPDGRVGECAITRSSGYSILDDATCDLIQRRFRYRPARDDQGRAVPDVIVGRQAWWLNRNGPPPELMDAMRLSARTGGEGRDIDRAGSDSD